jgi:hypothetical protein
VKAAHLVRGLRRRAQAHFLEQFGLVKCHGARSEAQMVGDVFVLVCRRRLNIKPWWVGIQSVLTWAH